MVQKSSTRARLQATAACAGGLLLWWRFGGSYLVAIAILFAILAVLAWLAPDRYAPVQRVLDWITRMLVAGVSWLLLGLLYLGLFTPLRGWRALTRRDPLQLKADPSVTTYFRPLPPATAGRFKRQF
jgi:hypothetical protein